MLVLANALRWTNLLHYLGDPGGHVKPVRSYALAAAVVAGSLASTAAKAQEWPNPPVRIINTFAPGGAADVLARLAADHLSRALGQQFFVETRAGAGGVIGVQFVAHAEPDGYNLVVTTLSLLAFAPVINPKIGYDPLKDLTNVAYLAGSPVAFVISATNNATSLQDFIARGRASDKPLTYSSSGVGSNGHLVAEFFGRKTGIKVEHVPYKGASQGLTDLIGGHLDFSAQTLSSASGLIRGNAALPLAHTFKERLPDYPRVPTFKELGYPELVSTNWFGLAGPAGLPADIAQKVNREIVKMTLRPDVATRLRQDGLVAETFTVDEFRNFIVAESARWKPMLIETGLAQ
jgi:tripartite-type tricarboxylate transporter receptor subunit TctC